MRTGWLAVIARQRRVVVHLIALALLIPMLAGVLPQPVLSAAAALDRDVAMSTCTRPDTVPAGDQHHAASLHDCCILCAVSSAASGPPLSDFVAAFVPAPRVAGFKPVAARREIIAWRDILPDGSPPRGPPALS